MTCYEVVRLFNMVYKPSMSDKHVATFEKGRVLVELYKGEEWFLQSPGTDGADGIGANKLNEYLEARIVQMDLRQVSRCR